MITRRIWRFVGGLGVLVAAALASAALIVLLRPLLQRYALARPNARSSHATPTPQGGGIAVVAATLGLTIIVVLAEGWFSPVIAARLWSVFAATAFIAVVGAIDDIRTIAIAPRLLLQTMAVAVVIACVSSRPARGSVAAVVDRARAAAARRRVVRQSGQFHGRHRLDDGRRSRAGHRRTRADRPSVRRHARRRRSWSRSRSAAP